MESQYRMANLKTQPDIASRRVEECIQLGEEILESIQVALDLTVARRKKSVWRAITCTALEDVLDDPTLSERFMADSEESYSVFPSELTEARDFVDSVRSGVEFLKVIKDLIPHMKQQARHGEKSGGMRSRGIGTKVFIVHGHKHDVRDAIDNYLTKELGLETLVMEAGAYSGRSNPEKLEEMAAECGHAVIICTADDELTDLTQQKLTRRIRQNVVLEIGYFWGLLGRRNRLSILLEDVESLDLPSDIEALGTIPITEDLGDTKLRLRKELETAGLL